MQVLKLFTQFMCVSDFEDNKKRKLSASLDTIIIIFAHFNYLI